MSSLNQLSTEFRPSIDDTTMTPVWPAPPTCYFLSEKDVHIWQTPLDLPAARVQELTHKLSREERIKAERFHFDRDARRFIVARGILRLILGSYLHLEPGAVRLCYERNGKPRLAHACGNPTIHFNLSHSEGLALYAFRRGSEIGVDIERLRDIPEMEQIAEQMFSARDITRLRALPKNQNTQTFFQMWTRKEAYIKALGDGLSTSLDGFDVFPHPCESAALLGMRGDSTKAFPWVIRDLNAASGFASAFATEGPTPPPFCWRWLHCIEK